MKNRIMRYICLLTGLSVALTALLIAIAVYRGFAERMRQETRAVCLTLQKAVERTGVEFLEDLHEGNRITRIAADGRVLYDNENDAAGMENHLGRPEVAAALAEGAGESTRHSATISKRTYYYAVRLSDGTVLRVAATTDSVFSALSTLFPLVLLIMGVVFIVAAYLATYMVRRIVRPINELDLDHPGEGDMYEELAPLLARLEKQQGTIADQMDQLRRKQEEFTAITEHMSEGFLVLDAAGTVLSHNTATLTLLGMPAEDDSAGRHVLAFDRSEAFRGTVEAALDGRAAESVLDQDGRSVEMLASPVRTDGRAAVSGAVVLLMDVTERRQRERLRREFTANVSHELKTPLTSISGYAEIIAGGIAKEEDVRRFARSIHSEAGRMIALVGDILMLSRLDEGDPSIRRGPIELRQVCEGVAARLRPLAGERGIAVRVEGDPVTVEGYRPVVEEMVYNLCDNAVKYNRDGGIVTLRTGRDGGAVLSVADTGIGIPAADQGRVFERFYRVDKSHSDKVKGTGLGLSIVKHGAQMHGAALEMDSAEGTGTVVTVRWRV